ncbi:MAG: VTT domain-containing protein [Asgard group archaeon]|nr:VTT domain-containing protein [Asgard group archaeon]
MIENNSEIEDDLERKEEKNKAKFSWTRDRIVLAIIFTIIMLVSVALLIVIIVNKTFLFNVVKDYFISPLLSIHIAWRVLLFLVLMVVQSLFAPIPSELILISGAIIFGFWWGSLLGVIGSMFSAAVTYYLSKRGGRSIIDAASNKVKIIDRTILIFDEWISTWGLWAILVGRAVPVIMFDPISYAAGLANIKDSHYFIATFVGSIPRAFFFSFLGVKLLGNNPPEYILTLTPEGIDVIAGNFNTIFFIIFGVLVLMFIVANLIYYLRERKKKQIKKIDDEQDIEETDEQSDNDERDTNESIKLTNEEVE